MPIEFAWLIPRRILLLSWSGTITSDDLQILVDELPVVYGHANGLVHAVIDLYGVDHVDADIAQVFIGHVAFDDPRRGQVALIRLPERYLPLVIDANERASCLFVHIFETLSEARAFLLSLDSPQESV